MNHVCITRKDLELLEKTAREKLLLQEAGGKGKNLWRMTELGVPVPPWFVVRASSFERFFGKKRSSSHY
jgi:phosphoenolpyruvate synthase/pyruvate phosphate dikinase